MVKKKVVLDAFIQNTKYSKEEMMIVISEIKKEMKKMEDLLNQIEKNLK